MVIRSSFLGRVRSGVSICKPSPADAASTAVTIRMDYWYAAMLPGRSPGAHRDADLEPFDVVSPRRCNRLPQSRQRVQREPVAILARSAKRALIIDKQRNMLRTPMGAAAGEGEHSSRRPEIPLVPLMPSGMKGWPWQRHAGLHRQMDIEWPVSSRSMEEKPRLGCTLNKGNSLIGSSSARGITLNRGVQLATDSAIATLNARRYAPPATARSPDRGIR